jgi:hypothetical protein
MHMETTFPQTQWSVKQSSKSLLGEQHHLQTPINPTVPGGRRDTEATRPI